MTPSRAGGRRLAAWSIVPLGAFALLGGLLVTAGLRIQRAEFRWLDAQSSQRAVAEAEAASSEAAVWIDAELAALRRAAAAPATRDPVEQARRLLAAADGGDVFAVDADGRPLTPPPIASDAAAGLLEPRFGDLEPAFRRWERREFAPGGRAEALRGFESLLSQNPTPDLSVRLWQILGAEWAKDGDVSRAAGAYETLRVRYGDRFDAAGWPVDLWARLRSAELADAAAPARSAAMRWAIREELALGRWRLSASLAGAVAAELERGLSGAADDPPGRARVRAADAWTERGRAFWRDAWPGMAADARAAQGTPGFVRVEGARATLVVPAAGGGAWISPRGVGWESRWDAFLAETSARRGATVRRARPDESGLAVREVAGVRPARRIVVEVPPPSAQREALRRRMRILGGLSALALVALAGGLWATVAALRRRAEANAMQADFVANVSHELRTPLASIAYIADRLSAGRVRSAEEAGELHGMLREETSRLTGLIDEVLDFSKSLAGGGALSLVPRDLGEVSREAVRRFEGKARARGFEIRFEPPDGPRPARVDAPAATQAILNLLDNAVKYSGDARVVRLAVPRRAGFAGVSVRDEGVGIAASEQARIFDKFYRVERPMARASEGGVGLGLALVRNIMDAHGGRVEVSSAPGRGSTFTLWFPIAEENA